MDEIGKRNIWRIISVVGMLLAALMFAWDVITFSFFRVFFDILIWIVGLFIGFVISRKWKKEVTEP